MSHEERLADMKEQLESEMDILRSCERIEAELVSLPRMGTEDQLKFNELMRQNAGATNATKMRIAYLRAQQHGPFGPN